MLYETVSVGGKKHRCAKGDTNEQLCGLDVLVKGTPQQRIKGAVTFAIIR